MVETQMTRFANCIGWAAIIGALHFSIGCTGPVREGTGNTDSGSSLRSSDLAARFEAIAPKGEVGMTVAITGYEAAAVEELTVKHLWGGHQDELARIILDDKAGWRSSPWYAYMERAFADAWRGRDVPITVGASPTTLKALETIAQEGLTRRARVCAGIAIADENPSVAKHVLLKEYADFSIPKFTFPPSHESPVPIFHLPY